MYFAIIEGGAHFEYEKIFIDPHAIIILKADRQHLQYYTHTPTTLCARHLTVTFDLDLDLMARSKATNNDVKTRF